MKKLLTALGVVFLCLKMHGQAITNPQVPVTGNVGCVGFPCLNNGTLNFTADANQTMTAIQTSANGGVKITSTVPLTATRTLAVPTGNFQFMDIENATMGSQSVSICSAAGGTCVTIPNATTYAGVWFDGTNFVAPTPGGGGSFTALSGDATSTSTGGATTVNGLKGNAVPTPATGCLQWTGSAMAWAACGSGSFTALSGDATSTSTGGATTVNGLKGSSIPALTAGYLQWNGSAFVWSTPSGGGTVTAIGVTTANGVSGTSSGGATPNLTISLGAITPSSVSIPGDGTHAAQLSLYPNTTLPTLTTGDFSILGPNAASITAFAWQAPTATNASSGVLHVGAQSGNVSQLSVSPVANADLANSSVTVSGTTCTLGGTCSPPVTCGGSASPCYLQQINPTTGATTTTTGAITNSALSIPVTSCSGFTFAPGAVEAMTGISGIEYVVASGCSGTTMTLTQRGFWNNGTTSAGSVPAAAWASGTNVIQVTSASSTSATVAPYAYQLANSAQGFINTSNITANTVQYGGIATYTVGLNAGGVVYLEGGTNTIYSPQATFYEAINPTTNCQTTGSLFQGYSTDIWSSLSVANHNCTVATNSLPPNSLVWTPATSVGVAPTSANVPAITVTPAGIVNVPTGGNYDIGGVPMSVGSAPLLVASPAPLNTTAIQAIPRGPTSAVNGVFNGDSYNVADHTLCGNGCGPTVSTNRIPEQIRINYQNLYGNGGTGIVPLVYTFAASPSPVNSEAWSVTGTYDTTVTALGPTQSSQGTIVHLNTTAVATFSDNRHIAYTGGNLYFATSAGSGTITIQVDGTTVGTASASSFTTAGTAAGGYTPRMLTVSSFASSTTHSVTFTASGDCYIYGWEGTNGTTGVRIHNVSVGGATSSSVGSSAAAQNAFTDLIPGGVQFETITFLTNDAATSLATATFSTNISNIVSHYQALTSSPTVVLVIPPVSIVNSVDAEAPYTAILTGLATSLNLTAVNMQSQGATVGSTYVGFGTATPLSTNPWFDWSGTVWPGGNGGIHPSDTGAPVEAQLESAAILNPLPAASAGCSVGPCTITQTTGSTTALTVTSNYQVPEVINSSNAAGSILEITGTATNIHLWGLQSGVGTGGVAGDSQFEVGDFTAGVYGWAQKVTNTGAGYNEFPSLSVLGWSSGISVTNLAADTGLSRSGAGILKVGNGTQNSAAGFMEATAFIPAGATFTMSGCSATTPVGASTAGSLVSGTSGTCTVVITTTFTAPHGYACFANDLTTPADTIKQTASTTTTATISGTTVSGDAINFGCTAY